MLLLMGLGEKSPWFSQYRVSSACMFGDFLDSHISPNIFWFKKCKCFLVVVETNGEINSAVFISLGVIFGEISVLEIFKP